MGADAILSKTFPFSYPQKSLWYDRVRLPYSGAYQLFAIMRCKSAIDRKTLSEACRETIRRHPLLSARIDDSDGEPVWRTGESPEIEYYPAIWKDEAEKRKAVQRYLDSPIPLEEPLFRVSLWEDAPSGQLIIMKWHHLVADAWSFQLLFRDFWDLLQGKAPASGETADSAFSYIDFCERSLGYPRTQAGAADLAYWKGELEGARPLWGIPSSKPMPAAPSGRGEKLTFPLPSIDGLPAETTLFEFCVSVYAVLLSRYAGQNDFCVAIPVLGRSSREERRVVGHFVNIAMIRLDLGGIEEFRGLLREVRSKIRLAFERQMYPFSVLTEKLEIPRAPGHSPLTDAYCGMIKMPQLPQGDFSVETIEQRGAIWLLGLEIVEGGKKADAVFRYPVEAWEARDVESFARCYLEAFRQAMGSPDTPLPEFLKDREREFAKIRERAEESRKPAESAAARPPESETQKRLWDIWAEVLGKREFGIDDDFFETGGHSLMAAQVMSRIRASFGKRIPLGMLFKLRSVSALAEYVDTLAEEDGLDVSVTSRPAAAGPNRWPLSFSQSRLWFLNRLEPESQAYNMHMSLRVKGRLDPKVADLAFKDIQIRHESLRTTFHEYQGEPVQVIHAEPLVDMEIIDLSSYDPETAVKMATKRTEEHSARPYDLSASAVRFAYISLAAEDTVLSMGMHHVIGDQWSWGVISRDLTAFFLARISGNAPSLPPLPIQYRDYADWQVRTLNSKAMLQAGKFWKDKLEGLPILELPLDRPRPRNMSNRGGVVRRQFSGDDLRALDEMSRKFHCTPYMALLACFAVLLHRYTGMDDLPIGTPTANRDRKEFEDLIGTFVNTLALRIRLRGDERFSSLLERVKEEFLEAYEYRAYPFEKLVSDLNPTRDSSHLPLVQVLFNQVNAPIEMPFEGTVPVDGFPIEPQGSQFDLSVSIDLMFTRQAEFFYNRDILDEESVRGMCEAYMLIVREALHGPDAKISSYPLISDRQRAVILDEWNSTDRPYDLGRGVAAMLWDSARANGAKIAAEFEEGVFSYERLFSMASALAEKLRGQGIREGDVVGIHLNRGPRLIVAMLAVLASGAAYVPVDPAYPDARKSYMVKHSRASALITEKALDSKDLGDKGVRRILLDSLPKTRGLGEPFPVSPESPAYVLYTSGSTGKPKGVVIPQRALANFLRSMSEEPGIRAEDRLLSVTPVSFDISGLEIYLPLLNGATLVMPPREKVTDPMELIRLIEGRSASFMQATPATWRMLLESGWNGKVRTILCGGEAFPQELIEPLLERSENLWNMYGPTETTVWSTVYRVSKREFPVPIGKPIANTRVYVLDGNKEALPPGVVGDVYIGGTGLAAGYRDSPEQTAAAFLPDPWIRGGRIYRTGDRGRFLRDGNLEYSGRADGQIKLNGHRIELGEIESALCEMDGVKQAVCVLKEIAPGDARLAAYLVPDAGAALGQETIEAFLSERLPAYMLPQAYSFLDAVPLTPSGKVDRKALPDIEYSRREPAPPADEIERNLRTIWEKTLNAADIGVEDDFFYLGGHSLLAVRLMANITREYGVEIPLRTFFTEPTVRGCARIVRRHHGIAPNAAVSTANAAFESDIIFPMSLNGSDDPVFIVAGVFADENGMYRYLSSLVRYLGRSIPIYCLRPRGLIKPAELYGSVREIALEYIRHIKMVKPNGPYRIIGECVGGIIAYEIARLLTAANEKIEALVLMDTEHPRAAGIRTTRAYWRWTHKAKRAARGLIRFVFNPAMALRAIRRIAGAKMDSYFPKTQAEIDKLRFRRVEKRIAYLARRYRILPYGGAAHLLLNEENQKLFPYLGWRDPLTKGNRRETPGLRPVTVKGDHVTRLTTYGEDTSRAIMKILEECARA